jgi:hypothetical protein
VRIVYGDCFSPLGDIDKYAERFSLIRLSFIQHVIFFHNHGRFWFGHKFLTVFDFFTNFWWQRLTSPPAFPPV